MKTPSTAGNHHVNRKSYVRGFRVLVVLNVLSVVSLGVASIAPALSGAANVRPRVNSQPTRQRVNCPWVSQSLDNRVTPLALANEVLSHMTVAQKVGFVVLSTHHALQNSNVGVPSLCIPSLTLTDGPNGIANGMTGVTQLPAAIGVAASFNPAMARATGLVEGAEARAKGIAVVQGPELNLARVSQSGRIFESFGEDPYLTSVMGVANVKGIQSTGELADAKHFSAYTQETARVRLNQIVSPRALAELYNAPFRAVVQHAHVASLMCSYGLLNGVNTCSNSYIYSTLNSWKFRGFVRSDLMAVKNIPLALRAGLDLIKPASLPLMIRMVRRGTLPMRDLNRAVRTVLETMFAFGLIAHPVRGELVAVVRTPEHLRVALRVAQAGIVLLKNAGAVLPLSGRVTSVAVIGTAANLGAPVAGGGSSAVKAAFVVTPLAALRSALGSRAIVTYQPGGPTTTDLDQLSNVKVLSGTRLQLIAPIKRVGEPGKSDLSVELAPNVSNAIATATQPGTGDGWRNWGFRVRARKTGTYEVTFQQIGDTWLYLNGHPVLASRGLQSRTDMSTTIQLRAGHHYDFHATWFQVRHHLAPKFGILDVSPQIHAAVAAARKAQVAIVFAGDFTMEGADRTSLALPGDANALISAVAAVNHRTIVVLNTGGAVVMPWLGHVAGVLEAWYPGQMDGAAIAPILTGAVDPSGRLPLTFPANSSNVPTASTGEFPGVHSVVKFATGLDIGYRWYQTHAVTPLFPFGFGLAYTTFQLSNPSLRRTPLGVVVHVNVTNSGTQSGTDVVQAYLHYPTIAGEPPEQLRAFTRVQLAPLSSKRVTLYLAASGFQIFQHQSFRTVAGSYRIDIGQSSANLGLHLKLQLP